ncbi:MAG: asparagine synthase (glutamine-hydrolyzing) [Deltaproteobacteria bacterium]|nr:asparagine synthase (glutamine-hydrolyzing) [Myxococcales bacterium]MDP3218367.1 asparagine synthase (glutamine-hydrolyzing) [Deltaproteobacteria bacterium]
MCGIAGFMADDARAGVHPDDDAAVKRMLDAIAHRGPDAEGIWRAPGVVLGHRRLSIIDLSADGNQPIASEDGAVTAVVNGEIYDFEPIREALVAKGHTLRSRSDSEVVLHLWEDRAEGFVQAIHGMFALALWDARRRVLVLARDRAGKKPLFYRRTRRGLAFASELHALVRAFPDERPAVDLAAVDEYLSLQYVPAPRTVYAGVYKLPPATLAVIAPGEVPAPKRYWSRPCGETLGAPEDELARELRGLLDGAVRRRMVADVPLGAFLSGGVDSSVIVALMARASTRPVKTFSIGFPDADDSELRYARLVAARYGTEHHELVVAPEMTTALREIVAHHGEPFGDSSAVATWYLARMTREHVTVSLSGDASDENFAGYKRYNPARLSSAFEHLPAPLRPAVQWAMGRVGRVIHPDVVRLGAALDQGEAGRYLALLGHFTADDKGRLYGPAMASVDPEATRRRFAALLAASRAPDHLRRLLDLDFQTYLADDINAKVDIAAMSHALEVRCPFLDTAVVEFAARLPSSVQSRWRPKHLLRKAVGDLVPGEILRRSKRGFGLPLTRWMTRDLGPMARDLLLDRTARERGVLRPEAVEALFADLDAGRGGADRLWTLLVLETWFRAFVDG